jgi:hypothetical protein
MDSSCSFTLARSSGNLYARRCTDEMLQDCHRRRVPPQGKAGDVGSGFDHAFRRHDCWMSGTHLIDVRYSEPAEYEDMLNERMSSAQ